MPEIFRERGYRFVIYFNDHAPPHCHVKKAGNEARVTLNPIEILSSQGYNNREIGDILEITQQHRQQLINAWEAYHGK